nr:hypothetical protein [Lacticaseibacillus zeae]
MRAFKQLQSNLLRDFLHRRFHHRIIFRQLIAQLLSKGCQGFLIGLSLLRQIRWFAGRI